MPWPVTTNKHNYIHFCTGTNIANTSNCYSFPDVGTEPDLVDGDYNSFSHSTDAERGSYDVCIFPVPVEIKQIKIWPRQSWWSRSDNLTLNIYEFASEGSTYSQNDISVSNLLYTQNITDDGGTWDNYHKTLNIPDIPANDLITPSQCNPSNIAKVPMIHGSLYLVLKVSNYFRTYGENIFPKRNV